MSASITFASGNPDNMEIDPINELIKSMENNIQMMKNTVDKIVNYEKNTNELTTNDVEMTDVPGNDNNNNSSLEENNHITDTLQQPTYENFETVINEMQNKTKKLIEMIYSAEKENHRNTDGKHIKDERKKSKSRKIRTQTETNKSRKNNLTETHQDKATKKIDEKPKKKLTHALQTIKTK